ncbi:decaprenyl-phosphate phosphoribosyltransferase [Streptomyces sp. NBC_01306]|uniref:decaprenyl-phosphate phosphoribosyltransferase n=1 Tax=Streptomyces sp. NBC_01306 TaxID=2903819 RepID=UPI0022526506|nr:decaprenyl-phosphate phosphoribosyltransferase [Streptomyces sp. NBC_01306]MCX4724371.1 decaprenyl-phosphate phosphoribosyltransferase [Streptomyces sp. NBC_01306]
MSDLSDVSPLSDVSRITQLPPLPERGAAPQGPPRPPPLAVPGDERGDGYSGGHGVLALPLGLLRTARPRQWVKNVLVAAAPAAAGEPLSRGAVAQLGLIFVLFTAASSAVYLVNDARDAEADRAHPVKCRRPVAAGQVPVPVAYAAGALLAVATTATAVVLCNDMTAALLSAYIAMQLAYCISLKHVLVIDLTVVTTGFLMRAMIGGVALGIPLSRWFLITAGFGALFMVGAKRYSEAVQMEGDGRTRALLSEYTTGYLRFVWQLAAGVAVLAYCLWAMESSGPPGAGLLPWRQLSMVPFILSILRYAVFADRGTAGAPEDVILGDRALAVIGVVWIAMYGLAVAQL